MNHPFECIADDDDVYWCKGLQSGFLVLIKEWIAGTIARALSLPLPPFEPLVCDVRLSEAWAHASISRNEFCERLSSHDMNIVFGSRGVPMALDVRDTSDVARVVDTKMQASIYLFDGVIQNTDRTSGNSNILLQTGKDERLFIIDHSNALSLNFDKTEFRRTHIFAQSWSLCPMEDKESIVGLFKEVITSQLIKAAWCAMPEVWLDESVSDKINFELIEGLIMQNVEAL